MAEPIEKFEWKKEYEVGINKIDIHHQKLVAIIGDLYDALIGTPEQYKQNFTSILKEFSDYTIYHFDAEEKLMEECSYPGTEIHKMAHRSFVMKLNTQAQNLSKLSIADGIQFYKYIGTWLLMHIVKADKLLSNFIRKEGPQTNAANAPKDVS